MITKILTKNYYQLLPCGVTSAFLTNLAAEHHLIGCGTGLKFAPKIMMSV